MYKKGESIRKGNLYGGPRRRAGLGKAQRQDTPSAETGSLIAGFYARIG